MNGTLTVINSSFVNNTATNNGGAILVFDGYVDVTNSSFVNNTAEKRGGAIHNEGNLTVINSSFVNNTVEDKGGAIYGINTMNVFNSSFVNNTANAGGAIYGVNSIDVFNSSFVNNAAGGSGGAIYGGSNVNVVNVVNSSFVDNTATRAGAIVARNVNAINSTFMNINTYHGENDIYVVDSVNTSGSVFIESDLAVSVDTLSSIVSSGNRVNFVVTVTNAGSKNNVTGAYVILDLPSDLKYVTLNGAGWSTSDGKKFIYTGNLTPNEKVNFTVVFDALNNGLFDVESLAGSNQTYNVTDSTSVIVDSPGLSVDIVAGDATVNVGDKVNVIVTVKSTGDVINLTNVFVELDIPDGLTYNSYAGANWVRNGNRFVYNGNLTPNQAVSFTVIFDTINNGIFNLEAVAASNETANATDNVSVIVDSPGLSVDVVGDATVNVGDKVNVIVTVKSTGDVINLTGIFVELDIPEGLTYNSHIGANWVRNGNRFVYNGNLTPNQAVSFTVIFDTINNGIFNLETVAASNETANATDNTSITVYAPSLSVDIVGDATVDVGDKVNFTVTVKNTGDVPLSGVFVELDIPEGLTYNSHTGNWVRNGNRFVYNGELALNEEVNLTVIFNTVNSGIFTVESIAGSDYASEVSDSASVTVHAPSLSVDIVGGDAVNVGDKVNFTVTVKNTGDVPLTGVFVELNIPDGLTYNSHTGANWIRNGNKFVYDGELALNDVVNFTVVFDTVDLGVFTVDVVSGSDQADNVSDSDRVIVGTPGLSVDVVGDTTVNVGDNVNFTVTVKNTGNIPLSDVFVELDIPDGFICDGVTDGWTQVGNKFYYNDTLNPGEELNFTVSFKPVGTNNNFTISATVGSNEINNTTAIQDTVNVVDESKTNDTDNADMDDVNSTDEPSKTNEINKTIKTSISKSSYDGGIVNTDLATGNPLVVLLACLLMILIPFRKRKH